MERADPYTLLHDEIVALRLSPGERLVEEELAGRLGASRGAVRAALLRLTHDGLVIREHNRGAQVRRISIDEGIEILEARAALEPLAAGYAALRHTSAEARELTELVAEMARLGSIGELIEMSARNAVLHRRILEISRHDVAIDVCARLRSQTVRFQFRTVLAPGRSSRSAVEHVAIVNAISDGDREAAEAAMRAHLLEVTAVLEGVARRDHELS